MLFILILCGVKYARADSLPKPWIQYNLYDYETGITDSESFEGSSSAFIKSGDRENIKSVGEISQGSSVPYDWLGYKVKLSAYIKTVNVKNAAGLYMTIDTDDRKILSDYMENRHIRHDTNWSKHHVVLNIPHNASKIGFGAWLLGKGEVRVDKFEFEKTKSDAILSGREFKPEYYDITENLNFESYFNMKANIEKHPLPQPWSQGNLNEYETGIFTYRPYKGAASAYLKSKDAVNVTEGDLGQRIEIPENWLGHRYKLSAYIKTINVEIAAMLYMVVYTKHGRFADFMENRHIKGDTDWSRYRIVLDIPHDAILIDFGILLIGKGEVRVDCFNFEKADNEKTTGTFVENHYKIPRNLGFEQ